MYNRIFKLWYYTVSHKQMLLRSIGKDENCNLDIYFSDVSYIELPMEMDGIQILETEQEDIDYITSKIGSTDKVITVLMNKSNKYYVVSAVMKIFENKLSMFELPFDIPNVMGEVYNQ